MDPKEKELMAVWSGLRESLRRYLCRAFPRLQTEAEDILQEAVMEAVERGRSEAIPPIEHWAGWFRTVVRHRALDRLREWERRAFRQLSGQSSSDDSDSSQSSSARSSSSGEPVDPGPGPATQAVEKQRRTQQSLLLSEVLTAFCRFCEAHPDRLLMKEVYERTLRGQRPEQIARAVQRTPKEVYPLLYSARQWILDRLRRADVDRSVFVTLFVRKEKRSR